MITEHDYILAKRKLKDGYKVYNEDDTLEEGIKKVSNPMQNHGLLVELYELQEWRKKSMMSNFRFN